MIEISLHPCPLPTGERARVKGTVWILGNWDLFGPALAGFGIDYLDLNSF